MLRVHLTDGRTLVFDLQSERDAERWTKMAADAVFQEGVAGVTMDHRDNSFSLPRPRDLEPVFLFAESLAPSGRFKGGERISCHAGDVGVTVLSHAEQRAIRVDVFRLGSGDAVSRKRRMEAR